MPGNLVLRLFQNDDDYTQLADILVASERADQVMISLSAADIVERLSQSQNFDIRHDLAIVEVDSEAVGYGRIRWVDEPTQRIYWLTGFIRPEWRGRGFGHALLRWLEDRSRAISKEQITPKGGSFQINTTQYQVGLHALANQCGYHVKESWVLMVRPNLEDIPDIPLPKGLEVRPVLPEQFSNIWYAVEEAYVSEGGPPPQGVIPEEIKNDPNFQPGLWQVAWEEGTEKVVGSVMTYINHAENKQLGILRGYTEGISTVPAWQKRGVAKALIMRSLKVQREAGLTESALVCSGEKPENYRLYANCGFKEVKRDTVYEKPLIGTH